MSPVPNLCGLPVHVVPDGTIGGRGILRFQRPDGMVVRYWMTEAAFGEMFGPDALEQYRETKAGGKADGPR